MKKDEDIQEAEREIGVLATGEAAALRSQLTSEDRYTIRELAHAVPELTKALQQLTAMVYADRQDRAKKDGIVETTLEALVRDRETWDNMTGRLRDIEIWKAGQDGKADGSKFTWDRGLAILGALFGVGALVLNLVRMAVGK